MEQSRQEQLIELEESLRDLQQQNYDDLIKFINKLQLHRQREDDLICYIDRLVDSLGGIPEKRS